MYRDCVNKNIIISLNILFYLDKKKTQCTLGENHKSQLSKILVNMLLLFLTKYFSP